MTNWMTAAGLAFIAGGLATLISFRTVIFSGGARRANSPRRRRPEATARSLPGPQVTVEAAARGDGEPRPERRRRLAAAFSGRPADGEASPSGLASIGLADDEDLADDEYLGEPPYDDDERLGYENGYPEDELWPPRRRRRDPEPDGPAWARRDIESPGGYGGRFTDPPQPGDYWTPLPDDLFDPPEIAALPPVPDYEPATGFDLPVVPPIGPAPEWPPREPRVNLPQSWAERDAQPRPVQDEPEERPSPRPRPYVSRHSAGPH
ncbi:hypothetical protein [Actinoplanes subglobosus]|uniref:Uncharacterized protein n=1 Tax=Actinoplanes subglobosus TaxID=1547892 RepID=A0ABV8IXA5_9ACTN